MAVGRKKGCEKTGGRKPGSENKATKELKEFIVQLCQDNKEDVSEAFQNLEDKDKVKYYMDMMQFVVPKVQAIQLDMKDAERAFFVTKPLHDLDVPIDNSSGQDTGADGS